MEQMFKIVAPDGQEQEFTPEEMCEVLTHMMWPSVKIGIHKFETFYAAHGEVGGNEMFPSALEKVKDFWKHAKDFIASNY